MTNTSNFNVAMGSLIRKIRESKTIPNPKTGKLLKMTQTNLANYLGVSFQQVQKYEDGRNGLSAQRLYYVCDYLGTKPNSVFEEIDVELWKKKEIPLIQNLKAKNNETKT
tara:strand:+ start:51 stop:380 length:330 start_codon:yes stop_codon:yes gene_type:complete